jgi:putative glutathione S-transferase
MRMMEWTSSKRVSQMLWGRGLPPQMLVVTVRTAWSSGWKTMVKQLAPADPRGSYTRPDSVFRDRPSNPMVSSEVGRYHLYAALACPWAHRALIVRALKGLVDAVRVSVASPGLNGPWEFLVSTCNSLSNSSTAGHLHPTVDNANGCKTLKEVYARRKGGSGYDGRATVPLSSVLGIRRWR